MILHYWKTSCRYLTRHFSFSLINILGLSIGIASCLLIYLYVHFELNYDRYNTHIDRIARVTTVLKSPESDMSIAFSSMPLADALLRDCPEIEAAVRVEQAVFNVRKGAETFKEEHFCYSEQSIFTVFTFSFLEGSAAGALAAPNSIILTKSSAKKYFGGDKALGQTLVCNGKDLRVTAVIADRPSNSDMEIGGLVAKDFTKATNWVVDDLSAYTFVLFRGKPDLRQLGGQLSMLAAKYVQPELDRAGAKGYHFSFETEALADLHFSKSKLGDTPKGNRQFNTIFSALAAFILVIALLNYINLSTAKATERAKEVAVRKTIGARPFQLIRQFLGESFFLMALAWLIAIGLVLAGVPTFNRVLSTHLSLSDWKGVLFLALLFPVTAILAGIYPAFVLSRFNPLKALKGRPTNDAKGVGLRKMLTVAQFVIALAMLVGTVVIYNQMRFIEHKDLGVDRSQMACVSLPADSSSLAGSKAFCEALRHEAGIRGVTVGSGLPEGGASMSSTTAYSEGKKREFMCNYFFIDPQFLPLLHISLAEGRNLSDSFPTDKKEGFLVNEAFVKNMGWKSAIGQSLEGGGCKGKVVGVMKNFFFKSLHNVIEPAVMIYNTNNPLVAALVKAPPQQLPRMKEIWKQYFPSQPFDYFFMDESFNEQYKQDRITLLLFNAFAGLAIFISCLGLYGLVSLITVQRTKEIGIRKVLGASLPQLVSLFTTDLMKLVAWAAGIALPLAGLAMVRWLSSYAYHTMLNAWMFILPVGIILVLALTVTALRIIRTALANPVESLRAE
ncbi:MAG TPA: ABC transporter permease [Puia sp.]|nr:ABC transporter permease [Puia sp.]